MNQEKSYYQIVYAPNDIFKKQAEYIEVVDDNIRTIYNGLKKLDKKRVRLSW